MKQFLFLFVLCLLTGLQTFAQDTIVTMTTTNDSVNIGVKWTGSGSIFANGVELKNSDLKDNVIAATIDGLVTVTVTDDAQLTLLHCYQNSLSALNLMNCTELTNIWCDENFLTALDMTQCPKLSQLSCSRNPLEALDVTKCSELTWLDCGYASLYALDITNCPKLKFISAYNQVIRLPIVSANHNELRIKNQIAPFGTEAKIENISHNGMYIDGNIVWKLQGESGEVTFGVAAKLPDGIIGDPFSGVVVQSWTME